jgi:hypothetical protein
LYRREKRREDGTVKQKNWAIYQLVFVSISLDLSCLSRCKVAEACRGRRKVGCSPWGLATRRNSGGDGRRRGRRRVAGADGEEACRSWRSSLRDADVEEDEVTVVPFPCSGQLAGVHGGSDGR